MSKPAVLAEPVLVGREKELQELRAFLNLALEGKGKTVFISGEAGSGKSRLAREFLGSAKEKGVVVLAGWCLSNAAVPYFPFFEAFNAYFTDESKEETEGATEITGWLKGPIQVDKIRGMQEISPQVWKDQTFAAVAKTLESISTRKPVILFLDDVHWADSASLALIHYIARTIISERVLLLATFRSEQLPPNADGRPHPLVETLRLMRREDLYTEIRVANLTKASVAELTKSMLGGDVQQDFSEKLAQESQGNALFVVESVRMLHERNSLAEEHEKWRLASGELTIPEKIKDIILQRLDTLLPIQKETLEAASVIGEEFDVPLLSSVLGQETLATTKTLDAIAKCTSLVSCNGKVYRFDHARSRDAIYDEVSPALRMAYHSRVARELEGARTDGKLPLGELVYHFSQAGNKKRAVEYAIAAGQDELARWSNAQAIEHFAYALQNFAEAESEAKRIALEGLGDAYAANGMYKEAMKTFDKLADLESGRLRLRAIRKAMDAAYFIWGTSDLLLGYAKKAAELGVDDRIEMARILVNRGRAFGFAPSGNSEKDLADSDEALKVFEEEYSLADVATALWRSGVLCVIMEGLKEKGLGELLRSVFLFRELGDVRREMEATYWAGVGFSRCFLYPEARQEFASVFAMGEKLGMFAELSLAYIGLGMLDEYDGKLNEAVFDNLKASEYGKKTDALSGAGSSIGHLVRVYSKLGDLKRADEFFGLTVKWVNAKDARTHYLLAPNIAMTEAVRLGARGEWDKSNEIFEKLLGSLRTIGFSRSFFQIHARMDYAWALKKQGRFEEAKVQLEEAQKIQRQVEARFEDSNIQAHLIVRRQVVVGEEFEMRFDLVNVGRRHCSVVKIADAVPPEFNLVSAPSFCVLQNGSINVSNKGVGPFIVETIKGKFFASKAGIYDLNPKLLYVDDLGKTQTRNLNEIRMTVEPAKPTFEVLSNRVSTGTEALDALLFGGFPKGYAVAFVSPSTDEREAIVQSFVETGARAGETTFFLTTDPNNGKGLAEKYPENFYLFVCNLQAEATVNATPNVFRLKGVESLTDIDIALTRAFRTLKPSLSDSRRICIEAISDILLQHHATTTRKWLSAFLPNLRKNGFTMLAVVDPQIHSNEELQAVLGIFDGEIRVTEKETPEGTKQKLKVRKLINQRYSDEEIILSKETLAK